MNLKIKNMVKLVLKIATASILLLSQLSNAQQFYGIAVYEVKTKPPSITTEGAQINDEVAKTIEAQMKKQFEKTYTLTFNQFEASWKEDQKLEAPTPDTGINIRIVNKGDGSKYKSIKDKKYIAEEEIMGKEFLVVDSLPKWEWKMSGETKMIGGYACYKAVATVKVSEEEKAAFEKDKQQQEENPKRIIIREEPKDYEVTVWYAPEIPVGHGPDNFWGLPGLILEANDGRTIMLCSKITLNPKEKPTVYKPKTGEKVSQKKFDEIAEKKAREMQESFQREGKKDGGMRIRIGG